LYSTFSSKLTFEYHHQLMLQRLATTRAKARAGRRRGIHLLQCTQCCSVWAGRRRGIHVHLHSLSHPHSHFSILFRSRKMAATRSIDASHTLYTLYTFLKINLRPTWRHRTANVTTLSFAGFLVLLQY